MLTDNSTAPLILLVEDDNSHALLIKESFLNALEEYRLVMAGTLCDALSAIEQQSPDLVLTDYRLPDGDGCELVAYVKEMCPVVVTTSYGNEQIAVEAMKAGALDYVVKTSEAFQAMSRIVQRSLREWALIQDHLRAGEELRKSEEKFRALFESAKDGIFLLSLDGIIVSLNESFARMHGHSHEEMLKIRMEDLYTHETSRLLPERMKRLLAEEALTFEVEHYHKEGYIFPLEVSASPITFGGESYFLCFHRDITERKKAEKALTLSISLLNATLESTADGIIVVDANGIFTRWNQKLIDMWHIPEKYLKTQLRAPVLKQIISQIAQPETFISKFKELYKNPEESSTDTLKLTDGRVFRWYSQPQKIGDNVVGRVWSFNDITNYIRAEEALEESNRKLEILSITDGLTGIANRRYFDEVLVLEHARHARSDGELSLLMLDIDHFKEFNDRYGHVKGDECLRQIARAIADSATRPADLPARYGGDEFACILPETDRNGAIAIAEKIRCGIMDLAIQNQDSNVSDHVTVSIGVVTVKCSGDASAPDIIAPVDELLYRAKFCGRNRVEF